MVQCHVPSRPITTYSSTASVAYHPLYGANVNTPLSVHNTGDVLSLFIYERNLWIHCAVALKELSNLRQAVIQSDLGLLCVQKSDARRRRCSCVVRLAEVTASVDETTWSPWSEPGTVECVRQSVALAACMPSRSAVVPTWRPICTRYAVAAATVRCWSPRWTPWFSPVQKISSRT